MKKKKTEKSESNRRIGGSFRDPSGFLFLLRNDLHRQVNLSYKEHYDFLMQSGLYKALSEKQLLISHKETKNAEELGSENAYKILTPEQISFISYPYEWCFSQLKDAALLTLRVQKIALDFGMSLKDASSYNVQFKDGNPIFIDTLSFEKYQEGKPWVAYRQFCEHYLTPLALMSLLDVQLNQLLRIFIDGIPLSLGSKMLPNYTRIKPSLLFHVHMHARAQKHFAHKFNGERNYRLSLARLRALVDNLETAVRNLNWKPAGTEWSDYYDATKYTHKAMQQKGRVTTKFLEQIRPKTVWDMGANTGMFSRIASDRGIQTVSFDVDPAAVEKNYLTAKERGEKNILPLVLDLKNPSPALGWENKERMSLAERGPADMIFALALTHHLAISNNVPLGHAASFFSKIGKTLIIEFIPKEDSQVKKLLRTREDVFSDYTQTSFEEAFAEHFVIKTSHQLEESKRRLYLMTRR